MEHGKQEKPEKRAGKEKDKCAEKLAEKDNEILGLRETLQRLQAEFENSCKRLERQKKDFVEFANSETIKELLPLLDSFQAAIEKMEKQEKSSEQEAIEGTKALQKQLLSIMQKHGLEEIKSIGEKANPMLHEIIAHESSREKEDEIILGEMQKGFLLKGRLLRPAKVKINKIQD